jgi:hypothetical protein
VARKRVKKGGKKKRPSDEFKGKLLEEKKKNVFETLLAKFEKAAKGSSDIVREKIPTLRQEHSEVETRLFLESVLDLSKINTRLFDRATKNLEVFMERHPGRAGLIETAEAINTAIHSADQIGTLMLVGRFENLLNIKRGQLWRIPSYMDLSPGPLVLAPLLNAIEGRFGRTNINLSELISLAIEIPENAREIFEGKTEESGRWIEEAMKKYNEAAVVADPAFVAYLQKLATLLSKPVIIEVEGDGFSTDGNKVNIPRMCDHFNTREENVLTYEYSIFHESEGHIAGNSFEVNMYGLDLGKLGFRIADPQAYFLVDNEGEYLCDYFGERLKIKTTMDLLLAFREFVPLAKDILNIVEDRRCDRRVIRRRPGIAQGYSEQNERYLPFRPQPTDVEKPEHLIEALLQLAIVGKTNVELDGELKKRAHELLEIYTRMVPDEARDATESFNATIEIFLKLKEWYELDQLERVPVLIPFRQWEKHSEDRPVKRERGEDAQRMGLNQDEQERKTDEELDGKNWYSEWDFERQKYIERHTHVKEITPKPGKLPSVERRLANTVKVAFMRLRPSESVDIENQRYGRIPREAVVAMVKDRIMGRQPKRDNKTITKVTKRSVAIAVLWDGSYSTSQPINGSTVFEIEGQAVSVFKSAADTIRDKLAIYVYNSWGRTSTNVYVVKDFDEQKTRFSDLEPDRANRDGAALRHVTKRLTQRNEEKKILIHICDALPADDGKYGDEYAEKDVTKAVEEATRQGVIVFAIVIGQGKEQTDENHYRGFTRSTQELNEAAARIYGSGRARVMSDIRDFPKLAPFLYRVLTGL